ncbi:proteasome subunit alpha type-5-A-like [Nymphaea colorata]|nr:proteasome subunit alpha type-5-A-like [Nymphaea colorata]
MKFVSAGPDPITPLEILRSNCAGTVPASAFSLYLSARFIPISWGGLRLLLFWANGKMFLTRTEYDRGVNTFSPEGRLFQVEHAIEAIKLGSTAIGIKTKEGVVLAVEKRITSPLLSMP